MSSADLKLRAIIVDDEQLARQNLALMLEDVWGVEVVGVCGRADEVLAQVLQTGPDLIFLDIQMPGESGIRLVEKLKARVRPTPAFIFVTAYEAYAVEAFGLRATDYLLKPFSQKRLEQAITHARLTLAAARQLQDSSDPAQQTLVLRDNGHVHRIEVNQVSWISAADHFLVLHTIDGNHIWRKSLQAFLEEPAGAHFIQIHRSTAVNRDQLGRLFRDGDGMSWLELQDKTLLKVSRRRYSSIARAFLHGEK